MIIPILRSFFLVPSRTNRNSYFMRKIPFKRKKLLVIIDTGNIGRYPNDYLKIILVIR